MLALWLALSALAQRGSALTLIPPPGTPHLERETYRWLASIYRSDESSPRVCFGTVISASTVLTAAHCLEGSANATFTVEHNGIRQNAAGIYSNGQVAIVALKRRSHANPLGLPDDVGLDTIEAEDLDECYSVGYANKYNPRHIPTRQQRFVQIKAQGWIFFTKQQDEPCNGHIGSPLLCREASGRWFAAGVTHGTAKDCTATPGIVLSLHPHIEWIRDTLDLITGGDQSISSFVAIIVGSREGPSARPHRRPRVDRTRGCNTDDLSWDDGGYRCIEPDSEADSREIKTKRCYAYTTEAVEKLRRNDKRNFPVGCEDEDQAFEKIDTVEDVEEKRRDPDKRAKSYCMLEDGAKCQPGHGYCDFPKGWCVPIFENFWLARQKEEEGTWMNPAIFAPGGTLGSFDKACPPKCEEKIKWGF